MAVAVNCARCEPQFLPPAKPARRSSPFQHKRSKTSPSPSVSSHASSLPTATDLQNAGDLTIYAADGSARSFSSLYKDNSKRNLVVFVRHFFCGMCQDFVQNLTASLPADKLAGLSRPTTLTIIGCGAPDLIPDYMANTHCEHCKELELYADPSREVYRLLGMTSTLDMGPERPEYQTTHIVPMMVKSILQILSSGVSGFRGGNYSQVGGEFLFDEQGELVWCHRMQNTRDHTSIPELKELLGVD